MPIDLLVISNKLELALSFGNFIVIALEYKLVIYSTNSPVDIAIDVFCLVI
jgi:hypothetical protein